MAQCQGDVLIKTLTGANPTSKEQICIGQLTKTIISVNVIQKVQENIKRGVLLYLYCCLLPPNNEIWPFIHIIYVKWSVT